MFSFITFLNSAFFATEMKQDLAPTKKDKEKENDRSDENIRMHQKVNNHVKDKVNDESDITKMANLPDTKLKSDLKYDENDLQNLILYARQKLTGAE